MPIDKNSRLTGREDRESISQSADERPDRANTRMQLKFTIRRLNTGDDINKGGGQVPCEPKIGQIRNYTIRIQSVRLTPYRQYNTS